jgi:hypothetical protein
MRTGQFQSFALLQHFPIFFANRIHSQIISTGSYSKIPVTLRELEQSSFVTFIEIILKSPLSFTIHILNYNSLWPECWIEVLLRDTTILHNFSYNIKLLLRLNLMVKSAIDSVYLSRSSTQNSRVLQLTITFLFQRDVCGLITHHWAVY